MHPTTSRIVRSRTAPRALAAVAAVGVSVLLLTSCAEAVSPSATSAAVPVREVTEVPAEPSAADRAAASDALVNAVAANDVVAAAAAISAGADLEVRGDAGRTPLVAATKNHQVEMSVLLLEAGADPNVQDDMQDSAFLYAGAEGFDEILRATIAHGADVRLTNRYGGTALIPASEHGYLSTVELLIAAGVPLDHVNNLGWTALHEAIVLNDGGPAQLAVVNALLAAGASPTLPDGNGVAPRDLAANLGYWDIVRAIEVHLV